MVFNDADDRNWNAFLTGRFHLAYACLGIAAVGILLLAGGLLWPGVVVLVLAVAILVDLWARGDTH